MAQQTRSNLKNLFQTGDKPTQQNFADWLDSFYHKEDTIPQSAIAGLVAALPSATQLQQLADLQPKEVVVSGSETYSVPAGKLLEHVVFIVASNGNVKAGFSVNAGEIFDDDVTTSQPSVATYVQYFQTQTTIHFTGNCTVKIYLR